MQVFHSLESRRQGIVRRPVRRTKIEEGTIGACVLIHGAIVPVVLLSVSNRILDVPRFRCALVEVAIKTGDFDALVIEVRSGLDVRGEFFSPFVTGHRPRLDRVTKFRVASLPRRAVFVEHAIFVSVEDDLESVFVEDRNRRRLDCRLPRHVVVDRRNIEPELPSRENVIGYLGIHSHSPPKRSVWLDVFSEEFVFDDCLPQVCETNHAVDLAGPIERLRRGAGRWVDERKAE